MSADTSSAIHIKLESIIRSALAAADSSAEAGNLERATAALSLARDAQELYAASGPPPLPKQMHRMNPDTGEFEPTEHKIAQDLAQQQQAQAAELNDTLRAEPVSTEWSKLRPGDVIRKPGGGAMLWTVESIGLDTGILGATSCDGLSMRLRMAPHELWLLVSRLETKGGAS